MKWWRSKVFIITLVVLICAGGTYVFLSKKTKAAAKPTTENVATVRKGEIRSTVSGTAQFEPKDSQIISVPAEGTVKTMNLTRSMNVKAGDILVELADSSLDN